MRFIVCARDREDGSVGLVSDRAFPNRREAVEAIIASPWVDRLLQSEVFLVDLEAAAPVALIAVTEKDTAAEAELGTEAPTESEAAAEAAPAVIGQISAPVAEEPVPMEEAGFVAPPVVGPAEAPLADMDVPFEDKDDEVTRVDVVVEIDIASWTCEDCIYVLTCDATGTKRPVECGSFQWRA